MLAIFLAHQMSVIAARRRIVEEQAETTEELAPKAPHSDLSRSSFRDICRTCLGTSNLQPIFCNSLHDEMSQKLKVVTGLEIKKDDNLPQKICNKCSKIINAALNMRITSTQAEKTLLKIAKTIIEKESANQNSTVFPLAEKNTKTDKVKYDSNTEDDLDSNTEDAFDSNTEDDFDSNTEDDFDSNTEDDSCNIMKLKLKLKDSKPKVQNGQNFQYNLNGHKSNRDEKTMLKNKLGIAKKKVVNNVVSIEWDQNVIKENRIPSAKSSRYIFTKDINPRVIKPIPQLRRRRIFPPLPKDPPFICPTCSRDCPTRAALFTHYRGHTHYFVCEDCGKRVLSQFALLQHQRAIHGLTKIHKCSYCDYSAADKGGLVVHERRHTGERPFVCDYCGAGFTTRTTLRQHIGVHMPATIPCPLCPKRLRSEFMLSKHKAAKHGKRYSYQCPSCPKSFTCVKSVRSHLRVIHKMPSSEQPKIEKYLLYSLRNDIAIT